MTFDTRGIVLPHGTDIATYHNRDMTYGNRKFLQKKKN